MLNKKKQNTRITDKIKSYMKDVSIDLFNYEEIVIENITKYFQDVAQFHQVVKNDVQVRISKKEELTGFVFNKNKRLKQITTVELIDFFLGEGSSELFELKEKVELNVSNYLSDYAAVTGINREQLTIVIAKPAQDVIVGAYFNNQFIETIPLKDLIKYFSAGNA